MHSAPARSWVEISRSQLAANFRAVRDLVGPEVTIMPVVKADAYRHGAVEVARVLASEGARWLAVSNVEEAVTLRAAGIRARILVMADFLPAARTAFFEYQLTPVLHSLEDLRTLNQLAARRGQPMAYHLKIDTGMGRLGTRAHAEEICAAVLSAPAIQLEGLMTHFASVTDFGSSQTERQIQAFERIRQALQAGGLRPPWVHMASTGAIAYGRRDTWQNMVRPGHAIYGYVSPARGPAPPCLLQVKPALIWKASVLAVKQVEEGALIGYGGMFRAPQPMRIAVLAVGYADGLPHRLSNRGQVIIQNRRTRILGAVSMDLTTVDATEFPHLQPGDPVTLLGPASDGWLDAQEIARLAGTISYSVLCGISSRVKRLYVP